MADVSVGLSVSISGLRDVQSRIAGFPEKLQRSILRGALRAAGRVFTKELRDVTPVRALDGLDVRSFNIYQKNRIKKGLATQQEAKNWTRWRSQILREKGELRRSVRLSRIYIETGKLRIFAKVGNRTAWYANLLNSYGSKPHDITRRIPRKDGGFSEQTFRHPGFRPRRFVEAAASAGETKAVSAFRSYVDRRVSQYWATGK